MSINHDELQQYLDEWDEPRPEKPPGTSLGELVESSDMPGAETEAESETEAETSDDEQPFDVKGFLDEINEVDPDRELATSAEYLEARLELEHELRDIELCIGRMKERGDVPAYVDDTFIRDRMLAEYQADYFFQQDYASFSDDPAPVFARCEVIGQQITAELEEIARKNDHGLAAAFHSAREISGRRGGKFDNVDWGNLSDSEFARKKDEVYAAVERGQLR